MPDILDESGLQVKTAAEILAELEAGMRIIYGNDINVDQNSPDGQMLNIFTQACVDLRELLVAVNNGFNPDRAIGRLLDERVVINNIERRGGTFTIQPVELTLDRTVTLAGLDGDFNDINGTGFTVQDDAGNEFILVDTSTLTAGVHSLNFRARILGQVETVINTIINPVTIVLGVTAIDNPSGPLQIGQNEETDAELRVRRAKSVSIASFGYLNGLLAIVLDLDGVSDAVIYENVTNSVDAQGIPAHGIWLIVEGGANTEIADAIYSKKSYGADMKGAVAIPITTPSGAIFTAKFDRPAAKNLYIRFDIQKLIAGAAFNLPAIKASMVEKLNYTIGQVAETSNITAIALEAINENGGDGVPVNVEISKNGAAWFDYLPVDTFDEQWVLDTSRITATILP